MDAQKTVHLENVFKHLDIDNDNFITEAQMKQYLKDQNINFAPYNLKKIFQGTAKGKVNCRDFISYTLAAELGFQDLGIVKINIDRNAQNHADATPIEISNLVHNSFLKFILDDKKQKPQQKQFESSNQRLRIQLNIDKSKPNQILGLLKEVFGRQIKSVFLFLKFAVKSENTSKQNGQNIAASLSTSLNSIKQLVNELSPDFQKILNILQIQAKYHAKTNQVFAIIELNSLFIEQFSKSLDQFIVSSSPNCMIKFGIQLKSSLFGTFLTKNIDETPKQLQFSVSLDADQTSLKKAKKIFDKENFQKTLIGNLQSDKLPLIIFIMLFEELQFQTYFTNVSQFFKAIGFSFNDTVDIKEKAQQLKQMQIKQMLAGFSPDTLQLLTQLKNHCEPRGQISLWAKNLELKVFFDLNIKGAFQLLDI